MGSKNFFQEKYLPYILWIIFFGYAACMALIFQNVIVPNMSSVHGGGKLLAHDAVLFDQIAWSLAQEIKEFGWGSWRLYPDSLATGNVGILAALYAIWGHDPSLIVPINAALHATAGVLLCLISYELSGHKRIGLYAGVLASSLFIIYPSSLSWYGQLHKDSYAITGTLLLLLIWVRLVSRPVEQNRVFSIIVMTLFACALIGLVRPYGLVISLAVSMGVALLIISQGLFTDSRTAFYKLCIKVLIVLAVIMSSTVITKQFAYQVNHSKYTVKLTEVNSWQWQRSDYLPQSIEKYIAGAAKTRVQFIKNDLRVGAGSTMDPDMTPHSVGTVLQYLPRAFQIASLAPFPVTWFTEKSAIKLLASAEMFVYYLFIPGIFLLLKFKSTKPVFVTLLFTITFLTILGLTIANLGTLYRLRYAYLFTMVMMGSLGWMYWLEKNGILSKLSSLFKQEKPLHINEALSEPTGNTKKKRQQAVGSSVIVMLLTLVGFIGFFYRDLFMAQSFGFSAELDVFFMALLVPMTLVAILCMPLGIAFTPVFIKFEGDGNREKVQELISNLAGIVTIALFVTSILIILFLPLALPYFASDALQSDVLIIYRMVVVALPVLLFSGVMIIGNTVLNALGKAKLTSMAQLIVPVIAITAIWIFGEQYGIVVAIIGMFCGQLVNLLFIQAFLIKQGYSITPRVNRIKALPFSDLFSRYFPLVASALFAGAIILINTTLAMRLDEGAVSTFSLGNKIVLLVTGLLGAAISSVMLPYFSALVSQNNLVSARKELSLFLIGLTFLTVPVSAFLFHWAQDIVVLLFGGSNFHGNEMSDVARVMQYAVVQIPFVACNLLLIKFSTATKHALAIFVVACSSLLINIAAALFLMDIMGVPGLALASSLAVTISTTLLVFVLFVRGHIELIDLAILLLSWLLFVTLLININFHSASGVIVMAIAFVVLSIGYVKSLVGSNAIPQSKNLI